MQDTKFELLYYATEADLLNMAMFGYTAKEWREANPNAKGNIRDNANTEQLLVLSNSENLNAEFIKSGMDKQERFRRLNETAIHQMGLFVDMRNIKALGEVKKVLSENLVFPFPVILFMLSSACVRVALGNFLASIFLEHLMP